VEASRLLVYQAAWLMDNERPFTREAAAARVYAGPAAVAVAIEAVQILGGYGYMRDVGMERLLRDAACTESDYGTGAFNTNPLSRMLAR
jgi:butyryl-CoA dehydrogenase